MKAIWKNTVIAESDNVEVVEGNYYFPPDSVKMDYMKESELHTTCPWKGNASYFNIEVDGEINENGAWYYPEPNEPANNIKNYVAFWNGVEVLE